MNTAVQLQPERATTDATPRTELVYGSPFDVRAGRSGPIAVFPGDALVAYDVRTPRHESLFVFRTLHVDDHLAASVPGVCPHVRLLLHARSAGRARRLRSLFRRLLAAQRDPGALPDSFWLRVSVALAGRLPPQRVLLSLLPDQVQP
jgi:hypothetical protein